MTREQLFAAPKLARRAEDRLERGKAAVSAARARATEIAQQCVAQPRRRPNGLQRRRLERLNGDGDRPSRETRPRGFARRRGTVQGGAAGTFPPGPRDQLVPRICEVSAWRHFEIELPIIKQGEFELAADLGCVRQIQRS